MIEVAPAAASPYNRKNPYLAEIIRHDHLTRPGSGKDTRHFVFSLADSGLRYTPGDSLAVFARNSPALVNETLQLLALDAETPVRNNKGQTVSFQHALTHD